MPLIGTREDALANRRLAPGYPTFRSDFLSEEAPSGTRRGNGKLVEQDPLTTLGAHFHYVNQFQVVVSGSGKIGRYEVRPITVQYAGAYTAYGPLRAGPEGLGYLVLRDAIIPGLALMPSEIAKLDRSTTRRYFMAGATDQARAAALVETGQGTEHVFHAQEDDGLAASIYRLPPGQTYLGRRPASGGGQFHVVTSGTAICNSQEYWPLCCIFSNANEEPLRLVAGSTGVEIVFMQFPTSGAPIVDEQQPCIRR